MGGALDPHGPVAREIADLWWLMLAISVPVYLVFVVPLVVGFVRRRQTSAASLTRLYIVGAGVVMSTIVLVVVWAATLHTMAALPNDAGSDALVVDVVGHQWFWEVTYPDLDVVTANEMHIPVGRPVEVRLTSGDVIHSFWVPELAGKLDALPEDVNTLVLQADEPGEYRGVCAEFCGLQHAKMAFLVIAEPAEQFEQWLTQQQQPAAEPTHPVAQRGQQVFLNSRCVECHTVRGTPATGTDGPDLTHVGSRNTLGAATIANTHENLLEWIRDPHQFKSGIEMPASDLEQQELEALVRYLESLQ